MKRKSMTLLLSSLLTVCLVGVGFASWLIVQDGNTTVEGQVHVETVVDKSITITASWDDENDTSDTNKDNTFNFTAPANATTGWLRSDTADTERLILTLNLSIDNADMVNNGSVSITWDATTAFSGVSNYIKVNEPEDLTIPAYSESNTDWSVSDEIKTYSTSVELSFTWGDYFNLNGENVNPYTFYNAKTASQNATVYSNTSLTEEQKASWTWANEAKYVLELLSSLESKQITVTITASAV